MKVVYLCHSFPVLSETFVAYEAADLVSSGVEVEIISIKGPPEERAAGLAADLGLSKNIAYLKKPRRRWDAAGIALSMAFSLIGKGHIFSVLRLYKLRKTSDNYSFNVLLSIASLLQSRKSKPDIVHCHFGPVGEIAAVLKESGLLSAKISTVFHGYDITRHLREHRQPYRLLFAAGDAFLPVNEVFRTTLLAEGAPPEKCEVLHMGVDCARFPCQPRTPDPDGAVNILSAGRMVEKKGFEDTLRAFAQLRILMPATDFRLHIAGGGELYDPLVSLARELGIAAQTTFHGPVSHAAMGALLSETHFFVLPSVTAGNGDMEGIPVVLMEAMASGILVASTRHSGIPELIEDGVSGILVPEHDHGALASRIRDVQNDRIHATELVRNARRKVETHFNRVLQGQKLLQIFTRLAAQP